MADMVARERHDGVGPVHLVEVDGVDAEAAEAAPGPLVDDRIDREDREELGGEERLVAPVRRAARPTIRSDRPKA